MTVTSGAYRPTSAHQPRGGRPWCGKCHTDRHLLAGALTVLDAREQTLAVAVTCSRCGDSRVLATTSALAADLVFLAEADGEVTAAHFSPVHCREPMSLVAPSRDSGAQAQTGRAEHPGSTVLAGVLRCRCGFQMDAPAGT